MEGGRYGGITCLPVHERPCVAPRVQDGPLHRTHRRVPPESDLPDLVVTQAHVGLGVTERREKDMEG